MTNRKFNVGVRFCGGCNPLFDRMEAYQHIETLFKDRFDFMPYSENETHDIVLIVNGCQSECLLSENYNCDIFVVNNENYSTIVSDMEQLIHKISDATKS